MWSAVRTAWVFAHVVASTAETEGSTQEGSDAGEPAISAPQSTTIACHSVDGALPVLNADDAGAWDPATSSSQGTAAACHLADAALPVLNPNDATTGESAISPPQDTAAAYHSVDTPLGVPNMNVTDVELGSSAEEEPAATSGCSSSGFEPAFERALRYGFRRDRNQTRTREAAARCRDSGAQPGI